MADNSMTLELKRLCSYARNINMAITGKQGLILPLY